jgi:hypothetical protein
MRSFVFSILVLFATTLTAGQMVRAIDVKDARTLIVDQRGVRTEVRLGDVIIPPGEETAAIEFLRIKVVEHYVMVENGVHGDAYVYRSPDALFINGELLRRAYLAQGTKMTIVGESSPGPERSTRKAATPAPAERALPAPRRSRRRR